MLKKTFKVSFFLVILIVILGVAYILFVDYIILGNNSKKGSLELEITKYTDEFHVGESVEISLSDFTDFEWDKVIVYNCPVSEKEISESLGFNFDESLDVSDGIIFFYKNKIVYQEHYTHSFDVMPFSIYPYRDLGEVSRFRIFSQGDALFECTKKQYNEDSYYYRLWPSN